MDIVPGQFLGDGVGIQMLRQPCDQMHAGFNRGDGKKIAQLLLQLLDQCLLAGLIQRTHAADMPEKMALTHEVGGHRLQERRRAAVHDRAQGAKGFDQGVGQYHVTQA
ncbi:hypothetical protein D3C85_1296350 [compost metagenome]